MSILMGTTTGTSQRRPVTWMPDRTINGHGLIVGSSGVGKTYRMKYVINKLAERPGTRIVVIDVHGDIEIPGEDRVEFSEISPFGLNPLKINPDPHSGGVNRQVRSFIQMINRTSHSVGARQEAALARLIEDVYRKNGFDAARPETWNPRHNPDVRGRSKSDGVYPNISDLRAYTVYKHRQLLTGAGGKAFHDFRELTRTIKSLQKLALKAQGGSLDPDDPRLEKLKIKAKESYSNMIDHLETGEELDEVLRYTDIGTIESLVDRIDKLYKSGIFKDRPPRFEVHTPIHTYDIRSLGRDEQKMFVDTLLDDIWQKHKSRGAIRGTNPTTYIVIDEASIFLSKDPDHILNILMRESRKFGIGLIFASQSLNHFNEDILANVGMKLILGIDHMFVSSVARMLRVDAKKVEEIRPRQTALVQCKVVGDQSNEYEEVFLSQ